MVGRFKFIRGVPSAAAGALPKITMDDTDLVLGGIVDSEGNSLLRYDTNALTLAPQGAYSIFGKDRGSGKTVYAQRSAVNKIASEALFANNPAIEFTTGSGDTVNQSSDMRMDAQPSASFTVFIVCTIATALKTTPAVARLFSLAKSGQTITTLSMISNGNLVFGLTSSAAESASIAVGSVPGANVPFVICCSYGKTANLCKIYLNNNSLIDTGTPASAFNLDSSVKMGFGGPSGFSTSNGWLGKMARACVFDLQLSDDRVQTVMDALKLKYGIA